MHCSSAAWRVLLGATATLVFGGVAFADGAAPSDKGDAAIGVGMICNKQEQAARFIELRANGRDAKHAMQAVNKEAKDPRACGLAAIAFTRESTLDSKPVNNTLVQVVRINIVAGFNGNGWQPVSNMIQYAVMEGEGETI